MTIAETTLVKGQQRKRRNIQLALPPTDMTFDQDQEWCVVRANGQWRQIRIHDYDKLFSIPGLYERLLCDILKCDSPHVVSKLLKTELSESVVPADGLRVLDLGAGNGMVGEELAHMGVETIVGVDLIEEAATATERDRPSIYTDYHVVDMTRLDEGERQALRAYQFNCLTCVAALGFGDIPPQAFAAAYNLIAPGGWIAFNIKERFLNGNDNSGFSGLIQSMIAKKMLSIRRERRYQHRIATNGDPLFYVAVVGVKHEDIDADLLPQDSEPA